jgi:osmoprotectant transport system substrate-binding protein
MTIRFRACAAVALAGLTLAGCGSSGSSSTTAPPASPAATTTSTGATTTTTPLPGQGRPPVVIGDKNYTEQFVLGELYYEALQAQGFSVSITQNIGATSVTMKALQIGQLNMYPEYLNVWNSQIAGDTRHFTTLYGRHGAYEAAQAYALRHGLELLDPTQFSDTAGIAVTANFAQQNGLGTIRSLGRVPTPVTLGGPPQFQHDAIAGLPALEHTYAFIPDAYKSLEIGNQYKALDQDTVQAAYVNTTDGEFTTGNYTSLSDPRKVFGIGNVVPVVSAKTLNEEGPVFAQTINRVSALLTLPAIRELNSLVDLSGESPAGVASRFLADHGLIPPSSASD